MLAKDSIIWAINFCNDHSDGDLFPRILEFEAIKNQMADFCNLVVGKDLSGLNIGSCRRFIVPKDEISYRQATQLDPQDSIISAAILYEYGQGIENRRLADDIVFSYRFQPDPLHGLYASNSAWNNFWEEAAKKGRQAKQILYCDIADFYNQIYHHVIDNQLIASGFPNQVRKWFIRLLESTTASVSRGIPIGPHAMHLLAEAALIPIDNSLKSQGFDFIRYADDIIIFCDSELAGKLALGSFASVLDKQQRLTLQRHKTKKFTPAKFEGFCDDMIEDRPISSEEDNILKLINRYSGGDPYKTISYGNISPSDWQSITEDLITKIITEYISQNDVDYIRLRWFYRRLTQIGHPGAIEISLNEISRLGPCFAQICTYLASVQSIDSSKWKSVGTRLLALLDSDEVKNNEYFRLSILSLFTRNTAINHFPELLRRYATSEPFLKREIILAAHQNAAFDWLREQKEHFQNMDSWTRHAFLFAISGLPRDEKQHYIGKLGLSEPFEVVLSKWSKSM